MLLEVKKLCKWYQRGERNFSALDNIDFGIQANEFVCLVGRSGSGKTTLLNIIAGILSPTSGQVLLNGFNLLELDDEQMSALRNRQMGYIPQGSSLLGNLSVLDNVRLPFYLNRQGSRRERACELLEQVGLGHLCNMFPASLSGGEARRVAIARALINSPELLLADEPTSDLDVETTHEIMQLLAALNKQGTALLMVTHDSEITAYASRVVKIDGGRITPLPARQQ